MRYKNKATGALVSVRDDKHMDPSLWQALDEKPVELEVAEDEVLEVAEEPEVEASEKTLKELKAEAIALGIKFKSNISKADLIKAIAAYSSE